MCFSCARGPWSPGVAANGAAASNAALPTPAPLAPDALAALLRASAGGGELYWRVRGPDGPRCEAWRFEPEPLESELLDRARSHLVHTAGPVRLRFTHEIVDGHLRLHTPEREREQVAAPGAVSTTVAALPCVFSGMSLRPAGDPSPRPLALTSDERWFLDAEACAAAGPDRDPQPRGPGEVAPLGCPSALADTATRAREDSAAPPDAAALRLEVSRRVYWLRRRDGRPVCEVWQHEPAGAQRGTLRRDDPRGRTVYGYAAGAGLLTLIGPHESRRVRGADGPAELVRARGCLLTRRFTLAGKDLHFGADRWYARRRDCERARQAGATPRPDPVCGAPP